MKKGKYLKFYKECIKIGKLPMEGLCNCFYWYDFFWRSNAYQELIDYFEPDSSYELYWGHGGKKRQNEEKCYEFTPLRQNIVLLLAAMNGEL